jgi:hypothetical protein
VLVREPAGIDLRNCPVGEVRHEDTFGSGRDRLGVVADGDPGGDLPGGWFDAGGRTCGRGSTAAAGEEEGEQGGEDDGQAEPCDCERPAVARRRGDAERAASVGHELGAGRISVGRTLRQRPAHHVLEPGRGGRGLFEVGVEDGRLGGTGKGGLAGEGFVEEAGERVLIGPPVDVLPLDLLRGDVGGRAQREAGLEAGRLVGEAAGEPEVGQVDVTVVCDEDVGRLDVAVDESARVGGVQGGSDLPGDRDCLFFRQRPFCKQLLELGAVDVAHGDVQLAGDLAGVVDGDDVRVVDRGGEAGLAQEALAEPFVFRELGSENLQRHRPFEREVVGAVDHPHPAPADQRLDPIAGELAPDPPIRA